MELGLNKANVWANISWLLNTDEDKKKPCVFLSHKREDKRYCKEIASYLSNVGIDYYLDENDTALQSASATGNGEEITECIKEGIRKSSHMLVVVSEATYKSQWVPFEIGYGHAMILDNGPISDKLKLSVLTLKDLSEKLLPDYLLTANVIRGTKSLNEYINSITSNISKSQINENKIFSHSNFSHPLDNVLNWEL